MSNKDNIYTDEESYSAANSNGRKFYIILKDLMQLQVAYW